MVHVAAWRWAYDGLLPAGRLAELSAADRGRAWAERLESGQDAMTYVAERGDTLVGFVSAGVGRADVGGPEVGELYGLYVLAEVAGTGTGRRLHDMGLRWLADRGHPHARLWVLRSNDRARAFYERCGWRPDGDEKLERRPDGLMLDEVRYELALGVPT